MVICFAGVGKMGTSVGIFRLNKTRLHNKNILMFDTQGENHGF
jgi:hypothetical protein